MPSYTQGMKRNRANGTVPSTADRARAARISRRLAELYPDISTALDYASPWQLIVSTAISAQTTDVNVNKATPALFAAYPTPEDLSNANPEDVERLIFSTGFYKQKTRSIIALGAALVDGHDGEVPEEMDVLVTLPGVGRKTASVVLAEAFGRPEIAVDTHVKRVALRIGLSAETDPVKVERDLKAVVPKAHWNKLSMRMIQFGRDVCDARNPRCVSCALRRTCTYPDKTR